MIYAFIMMFTFIKFEVGPDVTGSFYRGMG